MVYVCEGSETPTVKLDMQKAIAYAAYRLTNEDVGGGSVHINIKDSEHLLEQKSFPCMLHVSLNRNRILRADAQKIYDFITLDQDTNLLFGDDAVCVEISEPLHNDIQEKFKKASVVVLCYKMSQQEARNLWWIEGKLKKFDKANSPILDRVRNLILD